MRFRVFAALELPPESQAQLGEMQASLGAAVPAGTVRWVRPEAMHLTLKFYGDVPAEEVPALEAGLAEAARSSTPLPLTLAGLGVFPNPRRPQVIWAGLAGELEALHALQQAVEAMSAGLGYAPEGRAYQPHLTLGRVRGSLRPGDQMRLLESLEARRDEVFGAFVAGSLSLVRSDLRPAGPVYTVLSATPLGQPQTHPHEHS